ncbi:MAG: NUDIX domain-containing protein, partial [Acidimicrobiales bacterium]
KEELGIDCVLEDVGSLIYRATCEQSGLAEYEFDHVLIGETDGAPSPDPAEVAEIRWDDPRAVLDAPPEPTAPWLIPVIRLAERRRGERTEAKGNRTPAGLS